MNMERQPPHCWVVVAVKEPMASRHIANTPGVLERGARLFDIHALSPEIASAVVQQIAMFTTSTLVLCPKSSPCECEAATAVEGHAFVQPALSRWERARALLHAGLTTLLRG